MRDHERGPAVRQLGHRLLDQHLGAGVDRAGGLVQHQDRRVGQEGPGDGDQLLLARAHPRALAVDDGVVALRQGPHEAVGVRGPRRLLDVAAGHLAGRAVGDVLRDGPAEQPGVLQHHADRRAQLVARHGRHVHAVQRDPPAGDLVEPHQQVDQRGLARAGRADDGHRVPRLHGQRQVLDQRLVLVVAERHVLEPDPAAQLLGPHARDRVRLLLLGVQHLEDPLGRGDARLHQVRHRGHLRQRHGELARVLDERLHVTDRQRARGHPQTADHRHQDVVQVGDEHHQRLHDAAHELRLEPGLVQLVVVLGELPRRLVLPAEHLDQRVAGVHLLDVRVQLPRRTPLRHEVRLGPLADPGRHHERERHRHQRHQRQQPGHPEHHHQHADDGQHRVHQLPHRLLQRLPQVVDVVGDPAQHLAALPLVEVRQRQPRQLRLHVLAHPQHRPVDGPVHHPGRHRHQQTGGQEHPEGQQQHAAHRREVDAPARSEVHPAQHVRDAVLAAGPHRLQHLLLGGSRRHLPADDPREDQVGRPAQDLRPGHRQAHARHHRDEHHPQRHPLRRELPQQPPGRPLEVHRPVLRARPGHHPPRRPGHQAASASVSWESTISR